MGKMCITCKHFEKIEEDGEVGYVCLFHLDETTPDDFCGCWEGGEDEHTR